MVDVTADMPAAPAASVHTTDAAHRRQRVRYGAEWRFKMAGALAIVLATLALVSLLWTVLFNAAGALRKTYVSLPVQFDRDVRNEVQVERPRRQRAVEPLEGFAVGSRLASRRADACGRNGFI